MVDSELTKMKKTHCEETLKTLFLGNKIPQFHKELEKNKWKKGRFFWNNRERAYIDAMFEETNRIICESYPKSVVFYYVDKKVFYTKAVFQIRENLFETIHQYFDTNMDDLFPDQEFDEKIVSQKIQRILEEDNDKNDSTKFLIFLNFKMYYEEKKKGNVIDIFNK